MSKTDQIHIKAFPKFDDQQLESISRISEPAHFASGEELVSHGQKDYPFFVIRSGNVKIVERDCDGERQIANHGPREFVGDVDMLTGRSSLFIAEATEPVEAYRL